MRLWQTAQRCVAAAGGLAVAAAIAIGAGVGCRGEASRPGGGQARRVASLHDVTTEMVVALGGVDQLVGVQEPVDTDGATAAAIAGVTRVGGLESLVAVRPDLVVGLATVAEQSPDLVAALRSRGIEVYLADPRTLDDVHGLVRELARRIGRGDAGEALLASLARAEAPSTSVPAATAAAARPRVFVFDCCDPPFTAGGATVLTDLIERAGGHNVFAALAADWAHVSWEEVVARRPELVVIHAYDTEGQGDVADKTAALRRVPGLETVPVVAMPLGFSLGGLRSVDGLARLREAIGRLGQRGDRGLAPGGDGGALAGATSPGGRDGALAGAIPPGGRVGALAGATAAGATP